MDKFKLIQLLNKVELAVGETVMSKKVKENINELILDVKNEAINYTRCCMGEAEQLCECKNTEPEIDGWVRCKDCGDVFMV
jgi:hypothetical protein